MKFLICHTIANFVDKASGNYPIFSLGILSACRLRRLKEKKSFLGTPQTPAEGAPSALPKQVSGNTQSLKEDALSALPKQVSGNTQSLTGDALSALPKML